MGSSASMNGESVPVLLVEDSAAEAHLLEEGFRAANSSGQLVHVRSGEAARSYLTGETVRARPPGLILLDLGLPDMSGHELLSWLKSERALSPIPVVVFTSSAAPKDAEASYALGANAHIVKPVDVGALVNLVNVLDSFWLRMAARAHPRA